MRANPVASALCALPLLLLGAPAGAVQQAAFVTLWEGTGWPSDSHIDTISHDGSTAIGWLEDGTREDAIRWTAAGGIESLGQHIGPPNYPSDLHPAGVSADGEIIIGDISPTFYRRAFRWTPATGALPLMSTALPRYDLEDLSDDGQVAVGQEQIGNTYSYAFQAIWSSNTGEVTYLGELYEGESTFANATNHNGSVIVGHSNSPSATYGTQAFRWTAESGMVALEDFESAGSRALGISSDGKVIVGRAAQTSPNSTEAVRWDAAGITTLGHLANPFSQAYGASAGGRVIVGRGQEYHAYVGGYGPTTRGVAFLWDGRNGMRALETILEDDYGLDLGEWLLTAAFSISDDGRVIGGVGNRSCWPGGVGVECTPSEGWIVVLPPACDDGLDNDGDGHVDYPDDDGCGGPNGLLEAPECSDGEDNDGDGHVDWDGAGVGAPDSGCKGRAYRNNEGCGLGYELAALLPLWAWARRRRRDPSPAAA